MTVTQLQTVSYQRTFAGFFSVATMVTVLFLTPMYAHAQAFTTYSPASSPAPYTLLPNINTLGHQTVNMQALQQLLLPSWPFGACTNDCLTMDSGYGYGFHQNNTSDTANQVCREIDSRINGPAATGGAYAYNISYGSVGGSKDIVFWHAGAGGGTWFRNFSGSDEVYFQLYCKSYALPSPTLSASTYNVANPGDPVTLTWSHYNEDYMNYPNPGNATSRDGSVYNGSSGDGSCTGVNFNDQVWIPDNPNGTCGGESYGCWADGSWYDDCGTNPTYTCPIPGYWRQDRSGSVTVYPSNTTTYKYSCTNSNGITDAQVTVSVATPPPPPPSNPRHVCSANGDSVDLYWDAPAGGSITQYYFRSNDDTTEQAIEWVENWGSTSKSISIIQGHSINWWVHSRSASGAWSSSVGETFACPPPPPITGSCQANDSTVSIGQPVTWSVSGISGGTGSYTYVWSGDEGIAGTGPSVTKVGGYSSAGPRDAQVVVSSPGSTNVTLNCTAANGNSTITVAPASAPVVTVVPHTLYGDDTGAAYYNESTASITWDAPTATTCSVVTSTGTTLATLTYPATKTYTVPAVTVNATYGVNCRNGSSGVLGVGNQVTFTIPPPPTSLSASCSGSGPLTMSWTLPSGYTRSYVRAVNTALGSDPCGSSLTPPNGLCTDVITGSNYSMTPATSGATYNWWVHTADAVGNWSSLVPGPSRTYTPLPPPPITGSCQANDSTVSIGQPVTWSVSGISGGTGSYTYVWSGDEGIAGTGPSVTKVGGYSSAGPRDAQVVVSSPGSTNVTLNCTAANGNSTITVAPPAPTVDLKVNNGSGVTVLVGSATAKLTWTSSNTSVCVGTGFNTGGALNNTSSGVNVGPYSTAIPPSYTYQIDCTGTDGITHVVDFVTVNVIAPQSTIVANPARIVHGNSTDLTATCSGIPNGTMKIFNNSGYVQFGPDYPVDGTGWRTVTVSSGTISVVTSFVVECLDNSQVPVSVADSSVTIRFRTSVIDT